MPAGVWELDPVCRAAGGTRRRGNLVGCSHEPSTRCPRASSDLRVHGLYPTIRAPLFYVTHKEEIKSPLNIVGVDWKVYLNFSDVKR